MLTYLQLQIDGKHTAGNGAGTAGAAWPAVAPARPAVRMRGGGFPEPGRIPTESMRNRLTRRVGDTAAHAFEPRPRGDHVGTFGPGVIRRISGSF